MVAFCNVACHLGFSSRAAIENKSDLRRICPKAFSFLLSITNNVALVNVRSRDRAQHSVPFNFIPLRTRPFWFNGSTKSQTFRESRHFVPSIARQQQLLLMRHERLMNRTGVHSMDEQFQLRFFLCLCLSVSASVSVSLSLCLSVSVCLSLIFERKIDPRLNFIIA